jgi:hypothetical protein
MKQAYKSQADPRKVSEVSDGLEGGLRKKGKFIGSLTASNCACKPWWHVVVFAANNAFYFRCFVKEITVEST